MGVIAATAVLLAAGAVLVCASLAVHLPAARSDSDVLDPGIVGGILLLLIELVYLPNGVIFGMAYAIGPGFSVGAGTSISPTGVFLEAVPTFPPLAALPEPGPAPAISLIALTVPFIAGAVAGTLTVRAMPSPVYEAAPLWGFLSGALTGVVTAFLAALAGGPLGGGRMATIGPSAWQVGLMAAMEVGVSAAIAAWLTNWMLVRGAAGADPAEPEVAARPVEPAEPKPAVRTVRTVRRPAEAAVNEDLEFVDPEPVLGTRRTPRSQPDELEDLWEPDAPAPRDEGNAKIYLLRNDQEQP
jgi:hypothetical protein